MADQADLSHISLELDGSAAPHALLSDMLELVVDHSLHLPSMFSMRLFSHDMRWLEDGALREGASVTVYAGERPRAKLLTVKIAGLEPDLSESAPTLVVRGYDHSHRLYRGRHRRSFSQVTDADLVKKLAGEAGLTLGSVESTPEVYDYVFQNNQTNAEFLLERARRRGFELWVDGEKLHFRRPAPQGRPVRLAWGVNLRHFRARLSTVDQVNEVEVRGWDPARKREVVGRASRGNGAPEIGERRPGAEIAGRAWGEASIAVTHQHVQSPAEAERLAQASLDELASVFIEAEGRCDACPELAPGRQVQIEGVGPRFSGTYYVTQVIHEWSKAGGLATSFVVSGRRDRGLWSLLEQRGGPPAGMGLVIGLVTNNKDPDELGRVRVKFPWLSATEESAWARIAAPAAGGGRGMLYLPEVDDEVLVGFEHGDIHRPFILGALWNGQDRPPVAAAQAVGGDGKVNKRVIQSRSGHTITLDDTAGAEQITIVDKSGQNKIVVRSPDGSVRIEGQGDLTISAQGNLTLQAQGKLVLESTAGAELNSPATIKVSGGLITLN